jgi:hypothetical protein
MPRTVPLSALIVLSLCLPPSLLQSSTDGKEEVDNLQVPWVQTNAEGANLIVFCSTDLILLNKHLLKTLATDL